MKRILFFVILFLTLPTFADTIKGGISEVLVPQGFYGSWHVTSKIHESNNPTKFNPLSVDIWGLSGVGDILILENELTGAKSQIKMDITNIEGKTLKFTRVKIEKKSDNRMTKYIESPEITLDGDIFRGIDTFIVEEYKNSTLLKKDMVIYKVIGQKISGKSELNE